MPQLERERGAAAVEFALVFVMMATMLLALIEGGLLFMHQASVSAAAREGVRMMAITNDRSIADPAAENAYPFGDLDSITFTVGGAATDDPCPSPPDRNVTVEATVKATPTVSLGIFGSPQLTGVGAMRCGG